MTNQVVVGSWLCFFLTMSRYPIGTYVSIFLTLFRKLILIFCTIFLPLLVGFGSGFHILLRDKQDIFRNFARSFVKALAMMTGELDYEGNFTNDEEQSVGYIITLIFFVTFMFSITIVASNLIVGVVVSITDEMQDVVRIKNAKMQGGYSVASQAPWQ